MHFFAQFPLKPSYVPSFMAAIVFLFVSNYLKKLRAIQFWLWNNLEFFLIKSCILHVPCVELLLICFSFSYCQSQNIFITLMLQREQDQHFILLLCSFNCIVGRFFCFHFLRWECPSYFIHYLVHQIHLSTL